MRIFASFLILFSFVTSAHATTRLSTPSGDEEKATALQKEFSTISQGLPSGDLNNSFCYKPDAKNFADLRGSNIESNVRLASVSKVVTSFWALSQLGPHFRFETYFSWDAKAKHLHISGSKDPFVGQQVLMYIVSELNRLKIHDIELITFDSNFLVYEFADIKTAYESTVGSQKDLDPEDIQITILKYFNTKNWSRSLVRSYHLLRERAAAENISMQPSVSIEARNVVLDNQNPLAGSALALHWRYQSEELYRYLKHMNTFSINYVANMIFRGLGGSEPLEAFLSAKLGIGPGAVKMYTGSGIEYYLDGDAKQQRVDNQSDCETILKVIVGLEDELRKSKLDMQDLLLVAGVDKGTWEGTSDSKEAVAVKTGTLIEIPVANLVGMAKTSDGVFYFGIFFQMKDSKEMRLAHAAENKMVDQIVLKNGGRAQVPLKSSAKDFLPFSGSIKSIAQPAIE